MFYGHNFYALSQCGKPYSRFDHLPLIYPRIFPLQQYKRDLNAPVAHTEESNCTLLSGESLNNFFTGIRATK